MITALKLKANKTMPKSDTAILKEFLELPLWSSDEVFEYFRYELKSIFREAPDNPKQRFVYIEGNKKKKVVLLAHADNYFDKDYGYPQTMHRIIEEDGFFISEGKTGLGADDRAGCAMLYLLKDSGHSLLITDGEEQGKLGSRWLMESNQDIAEKINWHQFMIQLDLRNAKEFKCYSVGSDPFREFIKSRTAFTEPDKELSTDITILCREIAGVNLSVGYYAEHSVYERINISEWENTLKILRKLVNEDLPRFSLDAIPK